MKDLTKSDLINIEAYKAIIKMISNDIRDIVKGTSATSEKIKMIFELSQKRADILHTACINYPHIYWIYETIPSGNINNIKINILSNLN